MTGLTVSPINVGAWRVLDAQGLHVGNLKRVSGLWKFKAIGHGEHGELIPGGGPLTHRHNMLFSRVDVVEISAALLRA